MSPERIQRLRDLTRRATAITRERGREVKRLEKLLEDAGIKLSAVASDIMGVSGRAMLEALIAGDRDPAGRADLAKHRLRNKIPMPRALRGSAFVISSSRVVLMVRGQRTFGAG